MSDRDREGRGNTGGGASGGGGGEKPADSDRWDRVQRGGGGGGSFGELQGEGHQDSALDPRYEPPPRGEKK